MTSLLQNAWISEEKEKRTSTHRLLFINALDITAHGAAQGRVLLEQQHYPGAMVDHKMLSLQLPSDSPVPEFTERLPAWLCKFGFRAGLMLWLFPHLIRRLRQVDAIVIYGVDLQILALTLLAARITRTAVFNEITEHPHILFSETRYKRLGIFTYERILLNRFTGMIVISSALERYVARFVRPTSIHVMPPIAEVVELPLCEGPQNGLFTYAGSLSEAKDGVISLVRAFEMVFKDFPEARLRILGHGSSLQRETLDAEIVTRGLADAVQVHGPIPRDDLMKSLGESDLLVHCRPSSKQATYGFPTKLAEYLSCGRPVVTTITSDIADYLEDRVSAFLVPPDDPQAFACAMRAALEDRAIAASVGTCGRQVFETSFAAGPVVARLGAWIGACLGSQRASR